MKKIFSLIILLALGLPMQALRADEAVPAREIILSENSVNTPNAPINVPLNKAIGIFLQGEDSYYNFNNNPNPRNTTDTFARSIDTWWNFEGNSNGALTMISSPCGDDVWIPSDYNPNCATGFSSGSQSTKKVVLYNWTFLPNQSGLTTLTFKKYSGTGFNAPVLETITFTINVVDATTSASAQ